MFALRGLFSAECNPMRDVAGGKMYLQIYADRAAAMLLCRFDRVAVRSGIAEPFILGSKSKKKFKWPKNNNNNF